MADPTTEEALASYDKIVEWMKVRRVRRLHTGLIEMELESQMLVGELLKTEPGTIALAPDDVLLLNGKRVAGVRADFEGGPLRLVVVDAANVATVHR